LPEFPYLDASCPSSANCKRNHIITHSSDEDYTVFIGDGNSDKFVAEYCDFIFAKDDLLKYCERERITYFPFNNFHDVVVRMEQLASKKRLKKRHQAELKRRAVYIAE
jgi:2-hydroxy-3-keto-5-methylthiopentenyl-1-phosphate phosphatase